MTGMSKWLTHLQWKAGFKFEGNEHTLVLGAHKIFLMQG